MFGRWLSIDWKGFGRTQPWSYAKGGIIRNPTPFIYDPHVDGPLLMPPGYRGVQHEVLTVERREVDGDVLRYVVKFRSSPPDPPEST